MACEKRLLIVAALVFASFYLHPQLYSVIKPFLRLRITLSSALMILSNIQKIKNNANSVRKIDENVSKKLIFSSMNSNKDEQEPIRRRVKSTTKPGLLSAKPGHFGPDLKQKIRMFLDSPNETETVPRAVTFSVRTDISKKIDPLLNSRRERFASHLKNVLPARGERHSNESFLLTACTMVKNEAPYVVEWIEYNRIQGVDRIIIYDHNSTDNITLLNDFYQQRDPGFQLHVMKSLEPPASGKGLAQKNFQHCLDEYGNSTEWMMIADVDEYLYSPAFGTLASMLRNLSAIERRRGLHLSSITSVNLNFGSSGQEHRFENRLARGAGGRVAYRNPCGLQLITDHVRRGPARSIFGEAQEYQARARGATVVRRRSLVRLLACTGLYLTHGACAPFTLYVPKHSNISLLECLHQCLYLFLYLYRCIYLYIGL